MDAQVQQAQVDAECYSASAPPLPAPQLKLRMETQMATEERRENTDAGNMATSVSDSQKHQQQQQVQSQQVESGYSSLTNSQQNYMPSSQDSHGQQFRSLAEAGHAGQREDSSFKSVGRSEPRTPLLQPVIPRDRAGDDGDPAQGSELFKSPPPMSRFALPPTPAQQQRQQHPAHQGSEDAAVGDTSRNEEKLPTTPIMQTAGIPCVPNILTAPPSTSPPTVAGSKRTSSGAVKSAVSVPNSPIQIMFSPANAGASTGSRVDPGRIQEV